MLHNRCDKKYYTDVFVRSLSNLVEIDICKEKEEGKKEKDNTKKKDKKKSKMKKREANKSIQ